MRAQLRHVLLDVDFFNNPKIIALDETFGTEAVLAIIAVYCAMSRATNAVISPAAFRGISKAKKVANERVSNFEAYCLAEGLIISELGGYSNAPVIKDQESYFKSLQKKEKDAERKRLGISHGNPTEVPSPIRRNPDTDTDTDIDPVLDSKKNSVPQPTSKWFAIAEAALEKPDETDNRFITTGKRAVSKYPDIWLTVVELCQVLEDYEQAGIPIDEKKLYLIGFRKVQARIDEWRMKGKPVNRTNFYVWITGWAKTELLDELAKSSKLERERLYLDGARR